MRTLKFLKICALAALLTLTWAVDVYHIGVFPPPRNPARSAKPPVSRWIPRQRHGLNQLILSGTPYERGLSAGQFTRSLLQLQEASLNERLRAFLPNGLLLRGFMVAIIRWFWGIDSYFEPWMVEEMYGVSKSAPAEFNTLADPLTRQIAYHGLHEVGQMMVDQGSEDMGCTVVGIPFQNRWVIGRNFDFEGGRIFDREKIVKWVFPEKGSAFVSVIWAGMVGAVTGVNEHGLYLSLNAAGSADFRRYGTPSTLVLLKALQFARTADEAADIIRRETMFITDIFVASDPTSGKLLRIEKSPKHTEVIELSKPSIVTNHLVADRWKDDPINRYRENELTSRARMERGEWRLKLLTQTPARTASEAEAQALSILRDKGEMAGHSLPLGNRQAIDALIATHSVVYDESEGTLFVSEGPGVSGAFIGYDLRASFASRTPVEKAMLPADPLVSEEKFDAVKLSAQASAQARKLVAHGHCAEAGAELARAREAYPETHLYYMSLGDYDSRCEHDRVRARAEWQKALALNPAYPREVRALRERLQSP